MPVKGRKVASSPSAPERLPTELADFVSKDTYSLLIKGETGTGKTTLALTILRALLPIQNLLFLSTRTSPKRLANNSSLVEEVFGPPNPGGKPGSLRSGGWNALVDARLDEPNIVFERITNDLMDKQAPTVVIDSWESLGDTLGAEALRTNIRVLQTWRERAGARFIFVGEDSMNTAIDSMVEGVVVLKDRLAGGRRLREILLSKLQGVRISKPAYFFTLEGGAFSSFPAYTPADYAFGNLLAPRLERPFGNVRGRISTGYDALDSCLGGGYPSKSKALVEIGRGIDSSVGFVFTGRTVQRWLTGGGRVVIQPPPDAGPLFVNQFARMFADGARKRIALVSSGLRHEESLKRARVPRSKRREKTLAIIGGGAVPQSKKRTAFGHSPKREKPAELAIVVAATGDLDMETQQSASTHIRLVNIEGTLFMESELPWSSLYALVPAKDGEKAMTLRLKPVV